MTAPSPSSVSHQPRDSKRLEFLDALRGFAAVLVVIAHVTELWPGGKDFIHRMPMGLAGVVAFFLVSGYVIPFSLERGGDLRRFWIGRMFRLAPLYLTLLAVVGFVSVAYPAAFSFRRAVEEHGPGLWIHNLFLAQFWTGKPSVIGLAWSLSFEMAFYVFATVLFLTRWKKDSATVLFAATAYVAFWGTIWRPFSTNGINAGEMFFATFVAGTALFRYSTGEDRSVRLKGALALWGVVAFWLCLRTILFSAEKSGGVAMLAGYAIFLGFYAFRRVDFGPVLAYLGRISYSVYLVHGAIFSVIGEIARWPALATFVVVGGTTVLAPMTYLLIEKPAVAWGRRVADRLTRRTPVSA